MKGKMTGAVGLAGAFVAGVVLATALVGGDGCGAGEDAGGGGAGTAKLP